MITCILITIIAPFQGCQKEQTKVQTLATLSSTSITNLASTTASSGATISNDGGVPITARGVVWNTSSGPTVLVATKTSDGTGSGSFTSALTGLTPGTAYFLRGYATNNVGTSYGNEISFTTVVGLPALSTATIRSITNNSASGGGSIINDGGSPVTVRGIVWSTSAGPTVSLSAKTSDGIGTGSFTSSISGLAPGKNYFVRAYATNSQGTGYGNELNFVTLANLPVITTSSLTNITSSSANGGGTVSDDGGAAVTARGLVWDTSSAPTISLSTKTTDGAGTGSFLSNVGGLMASTNYYIRAYATNAAGTSYGNEFTLTTLSAQSHDANKVRIPIGGNAFADNGAVIDTVGLSNWTNPATVCKTFIRPTQSGYINVSLKINPTNGYNVISVKVLNKTIPVTITGNTASEVFIGQFEVASSGYLSIDVQGVSKTSAGFGLLSSIYVSGTAVTSTMAYVPNNIDNLYYWGRRGTALSVAHDYTGINNIEYYYSEVTVPANYDAIGSYYMANGFGEGYFGMQVKSANERWVLFSVWSPNTTNDPTSILPEDKVILSKAGTSVVTGTFGNEGSGGQSYLVYNWKADNTYKFLVKGTPIAGNYTQYTAWFFAPEQGSWLLIASWNRPKTSTYLTSLYSFIENFMPETGNTTRMAYYGNQWVKPSGGNWTELTKATVTGSPENQYRKDYAGGLATNKYYLKISGFFSQNTPLNQVYTRPASGIPPTIDLSKLP